MSPRRRQSRREASAQIIVRNAAKREAAAGAMHLVDLLRRDYANTKAMIFGSAPEFDRVLTSIAALDGSQILRLD